jgi:riboflavin synthase
MFTGIVRERGRVASLQQEPEGLRFEIDAPATASELGIGDSVSVSGACLTATGVSNGRFSVTAVAETLDRTTLGRLAPQDEVNLETATRAGDPLGGHFVQGHVDAVGRVASVEDARVWVEAAPEILRYCVEKGSITVDGVSLTIAGLRDDAFEVALIPHTLEVTTLGALEPGDEVNLEVDVLAKYVEKLIDRDTISG